MFFTLFFAPLIYYVVAVLLNGEHVGCHFCTQPSLKDYFIGHPDWTVLRLKDTNSNERFCVPAAIKNLERSQVHIMEVDYFFHPLLRRYGVMYHPRSAPDRENDRNDS